MNGLLAELLGFLVMFALLMLVLRFTTTKTKAIVIPIRKDKDEQ